MCILRTTQRHSEPPSRGSMRLLHPKRLWLSIALVHPQKTLKPRKSRVDFFIFHTRLATRERCVPDRKVCDQRIDSEIQHSAACLVKLWVRAGLDIAQGTGSWFRSLSNPYWSLWSDSDVNLLWRKRHKPNQMSYHSTALRFNPYIQLLRLSVFKVHL